LLNQITYSQYREKKYPIGSGVTEIVQGVRWKEKGAGIILSLRVLVLAKNGVNFGQNLIGMDSR
jgi:hypothetical protein